MGGGEEGGEGLPNLPFALAVPVHSLGLSQGVTVRSILPVVRAVRGDLNDTTTGIMGLPCFDCDSGGGSGGGGGKFDLSASVPDWLLVTSAAVRLGGVYSPPQTATLKRAQWHGEEGGGGMLYDWVGLGPTN